MEAGDLDLDLGEWMGQLRREVSTGWWRLTVAVEDDRSWVGDLGHLMEEGLLMDSGRSPGKLVPAEDSWFCFVKGNSHWRVRDSQWELKDNRYERCVILFG